MRSHHKALDLFEAIEKANCLQQILKLIDMDQKWAECSMCGLVEIKHHRESNGELIPYCSECGQEV